MDLLPYVARLQRDLEIAAEAGGEEARALAERLTAPLESAARLVLLEALSDAAAEITRELAPGSVDVRLRGRDPDLVVSPPPPPASDEDTTDLSTGWATTGSTSRETADIEEGGTARLSLRIPDRLKPRIEEAADREGLSVNAWLVRAVTAAVERGGRTGPARPATRPDSLGQRHTGWVR
jgi:hypothetical protein